MDDGSETEAANERPTGRDAVRAAILAAASRRFAQQGRKASLRDIAADAGVNLGLIHRHFGNKDDLLRAALNAHTGAGAAMVEGEPDLAAATRRIFEESGAGAPYLRIVAWLLLEDAPVATYQDRFPTIESLRARAGDDAQELRLLLAFAASYGWTVFGDQLLAAFGRDATEHDALTARLAALVEELLAPHETK